MRRSIANEFAANDRREEINADPPKLLVAVPRLWGL
jgi:hypothetical protein